MNHWVLDEDGEPREATLEEWARWYQTADRRVALDVVGHYRVSTVFLGLNHNFLGDGRPPILWETMVFNEAAPVEEGFAERFPEMAAKMPHSMMDLEQERYSSRADALQGHAAMVERVRMALKLEAWPAAVEVDP